MEFINKIIGTPLGYLMWLCYIFIKDYGLAIILFTLLTRVILFPISLIVQKNSIKMIRMKPKLEALKLKYIDDKDKFIDAQTELYKQEKYSPMAGVWPLLLQLPIILGLIDVIYKPLKHLLHLPADVINAFADKTSQILGVSVAELGSSPQLKIVELLNNPEYASEFLGLQSILPNVNIQETINTIQSVNMNFLGINMAAIPKINELNILFLVPVLAGLSSLLLCYIQNKINVLQIEQSKWSQWGMSVFMVAFSTYFAFIVPAGVGIYWIMGNIFGIIVMYIVNAIYDPKKHIDYEELNRMKESIAEEQAKSKLHKARAKSDYKRFCRDENLEKMKLMFYSEQSGFYKYFANIIDAILKESDLVIHYVTSDPDDAVFKFDNPKFISYYVDEARLIPLMMKVEADVVVMTTPDLERYHVKRSKVRKDVEYIYVDHACTSLNMTYRTGAFDFFDTIFAVSQNQADEIRAIEEQRKTKKKNIINCGYALIDNMISSYEQMEKTENDKKTILIAPSWQEDNILDSCLDSLLGSILNRGYRVIVRPHPQYIRRFPMNMDSIVRKYEEYMGEDFDIEKDFSSNVTVYTADLVITDWSAIAYEFSFTTNKPTLFVNTKMKIINPEYKKIDIVPFDIEGRKIIGETIEKSDAENVYEVIEELLNNKEAYYEQIEKAKNEYFFNLGHSGEVGAQYIIDKINHK